MNFHRFFGLRCENFTTFQKGLGKTPLEVPVMESCMECGASQLGSSSLLDSNVMNPGPGVPSYMVRQLFLLS